MILRHNINSVEGIECGLFMLKHQCFGATGGGHWEAPDGEIPEIPEY